MATGPKIADSIANFNTYRNEQRERVQAMHEMIDIYGGELRTRGLVATHNFCVELKDLLHRKTQSVEGELLKLAEMQKVDPEMRVGPVTLTRVMEAIHAIEDVLSRQDEIATMVVREEKYQLRMIHARDIFFGNRALLDDMIARIASDTVGHATMDLVARLHELRMSARRLTIGMRQEVLVDYRCALKNIGTFVRLVKCAHRIYCKIYPIQE